MSDMKGNLSFRVVSLAFVLRDLLSPPQGILAEVGIKPGDEVLDFGCGPGSFTLAAAAMVGAAGKVYALDVSPAAIRQTRARAASKGLTQVETILSDGATGLPPASVNAILLHDLRQPDAVLAELHRVLKPGGILSVSGHHLKHEQLVSQVAGSGRYALAAKGKKTYTFLSFP